MNLFLAYMYGDFDVPTVIGVGTDFEQAEKIIKKDFKKYNETGELIEIKKGNFRKPDSDISETDFFIREIHANTLI